MGYVNKVFLMGNLTRDPELRYLSHGLVVYRYPQKNLGFVAGSVERRQQIDRQPLNLAQLLAPGLRRPGSELWWYASPKDRKFQLEVARRQETASIWALGFRLRAFSLMGRCPVSGLRVGAATRGKDQA